MLTEFEVIVLHKYKLNDLNELAVILNLETFKFNLNTEHLQMILRSQELVISHIIEQIEIVAAKEWNDLFEHHLCLKDALSYILIYKVDIIVI